MISISVDHKDMMFVRMKRMLSEIHTIRKQEFQKHILKKVSYTQYSYTFYRLTILTSLAILSVPYSYLSID